MHKNKVVSCKYFCKIWNRSRRGGNASIYSYSINIYGSRKFVGYNGRACSSRKIVGPNRTCFLLVDGLKWDLLAYRAPSDISSRICLILLQWFCFLHAYCLYSHHFYCTVDLFAYNHLLPLKMGELRPVFCKGPFCLWRFYVNII